MKISLDLDLGLLGKLGALLVPNDKKEEGTRQPDFHVVRMVDDKWKRVGAGWKKLDGTK